MSTLTVTELRTQLDGMRSLAKSTIRNLSEQAPQSQQEHEQHTARLMYAKGYEKAIDEVGLHFFGLEFLGIATPDTLTTEIEQD